MRIKFTCLFVCTITLFSLITPFSQVRATTQKEVVIINQVRGTECCSVGSLEATQKQIDELQKLQFPATFALRYDAIQDQGFGTLFTQKRPTPVDVGIFLEITPQLAHNAGVPYVGPVDRWYKAKNAFLLGYSPADRKKIIDTIFAAFFQQYHFYPKTTVAWMIDSSSLQYLSDKYHVTTHELTRDQWSTDSYTLYGGPINTPYLPSKNWPLIPAHVQTDSIPVLMLRQTIYDPLYAYGDILSVFTSQPNDYLRNQLDLNYFQSLFQSSMEQQSPNGFSVIGLENSMDKPYQTEFFKQLDFIHSYLLQHPETAVVLSKDLSPTIAFNASPNALAFNFRSDAQKNQFAYWITTSSYRARLFIKKNQVLLTDLRMYDDALLDPYRNDTPVSLNAYWIVPFWWDSSRYNTPTTEGQKDIFQHVVSALVKNGPDVPQFNTIFNESDSMPTGLHLPERSDQVTPDVQQSTQGVEIAYQTPEGQQVRLHFSPSTMTFSLPNPKQLQLKSDNFSLQNWENQMEHTGFIQLNASFSANTLQITPTLPTAASTSAFIHQFLEYMFPENVVSRASLKHSTILYSNHSAIIGQNPMRIVIFLKDAQGKVVTSQESIQMKAKAGEFDAVIIHQPETSQGEYYIDLQSNTPKKMTPIMQLGDQQLQLDEVTFVANCKNDVWSCVRHPIQLWEFIVTKVTDLFRKK